MKSERYLSETWFAGKIDKLRCTCNLYTYGKWLRWGELNMNLFAQKKCINQIKPANWEMVLHQAILGDAVKQKCACILHLFSLHFCFAAILNSTVEEQGGKGAAYKGKRSERKGPKGKERILSGLSHSFCFVLRCSFPHLSHFPICLKMAIARSM